MEANAERALEIGVNVFIFIIALTSAMMLLSNVLNISEAANDIIKDTSNSTLLELYGDTEERIYQGDEVIAVINEYLSETAQVNKDVILKLTNSDTEVPKEVKEINISLNILKSNYHLVYDGFDEDNKKDVYIFTKIPVEEVGEG